MNCINRKTLYVGNEPINVPCGKCIPCLTNKRSDWSFRLEQEHKVSKSAHFVTLTYDQKHCPSDGSLDKRHLQLYMKRLRKKDQSQKLRYYAVGEYGSKTGRPHYHLLLFNSCECHIRESWKDSKGHDIGIVHVGNVTAASVAYVTKYMIQKDDYDTTKQKPFALMSRAYGIGARYLSDNMVEWHRSNGNNFVLRPSNVKGRLPRFYREKIWPTINLRPRKKVTRVVLNTWKVIKYRLEKERKAVSSAAMELTLNNQKKEFEYYEKKYGSRAMLVMEDARDKLLSRVKNKIAFTQTF